MTTKPAWIGIVTLTLAGMTAAQEPVSFPTQVLRSDGAPINPLQQIPF